MAESMSDTLVYVSNAGSKEVYVLTMNRESGDLTVLGASSGRATRPAGRRGRAPAPARSN
jgi:hypothetical protein